MSNSLKLLKRSKESFLITTKTGRVTDLYDQKTGTGTTVRKTVDRQVSWIVTTENGVLWSLV